MLTAIIAIIAIASIVYGVYQKIAALSLSAYIVKKYTLPTDTELEECSKYVVENLFRKG